MFPFRKTPESRLVSPPIGIPSAIEEEIEAKRLYAEFAAVDGFTPAKAEKAIATMALAGTLQLGVALRLMLLCSEAQTP